MNRLPQKPPNERYTAEGQNTAYVSMVLDNANWMVVYILKAPTP
jgi:hypothetical protein